MTYFWSSQFSVLLVFLANGTPFFNYPTHTVSPYFIIFLPEYFQICKDTFEKNLMSLVDVLKLFLLLKMLDGLRSFMLMEAVSKYWISFSSRLYANLSSTEALAAACSDSVPPPRIGLSRRKISPIEVFM